MGALQQVFITICLVLVVRGEVVIVNLPHITRDSHGRCHLPDVINIEVLRLTEQGQEYGLELELSRNDVIPTHNMVYVMRQDEYRGTRIEQVELRNAEHEAMQSYHDQHHGAAFIVKCTRKRWYGQFYALEGSVYYGRQKFRLTPTASWQEELEIMTNHVKVTYNLMEIQDFEPRDAAIVAETSQVLERKAREAAKDNLRFRYRRQTNVTYYIDILSVVDFQLYQRWKEHTNDPQRAITEYLANSLTSVALRLETLSLGGRKLKIRMMTPVFLVDAKSAPYDAPAGGQFNSTEVLFIFKNWLVQQKDEAPFQGYDHALLFTSFTLFGGNDEGIKFNVTKGLAFLGGMCNTPIGESSSVIEDKGAYQSEGVIAHELGHSLGASHDGNGNPCRSTDRYLMADTTYAETSNTATNPWKFSPCSSDAIQKKLEALESDDTTYGYLGKCLKDSVGVAVQNYTTVYPNNQCRDFYGNQSFMCRGTNVPPFSSLCEDFYCRLPDKDKCEKITAATGTCCGNGKKCNAGVCGSAASGECQMNDACPLGDQPGIVLNGKTCAELESTYCYDGDVRAKCCDSCETKKRTNAVCLYGDKKAGCKQTGCGSIIDTPDFLNFTYDYICCETCNVKCLDRQTVTLPGENVAKSCEKAIINEGNEYICYSPGVQSNGCCKSCQQARSPDNLECPWNDDPECPNLLATPVGYTCTEEYRSRCCKKCLLTEKRTTSTTTTTTTDGKGNTISKGESGNTGTNNDGGNTAPPTTINVKDTKSPGDSGTKSSSSSTDAAACESGTYGKNCAEKCNQNCAGGGSCSKDSGACLGGCKDGYTGQTCSEQSTDSKSGLDIMPLAVGIAAGVFVLIVIIGIVVCCCRRNSHASSSKQKLAAHSSKHHQSSSKSRHSRDLPPYKEKQPYDKQRSALDKQRSSFEKQRPSYDKQRPSYDKQRPSFEKQRPSYDKQRPSYDKQRPSYDKQRPSYDKQRPSYDMQRPSFDQQRSTKQQRLPRYDNVDETGRNHMRNNRGGPSDLWSPRPNHSSAQWNQRNGGY